MACSADFKAQAFRIFAEDNAISSDHWWLIAVETARWVEKPLFENGEALWNEGWQLFAMADGIEPPLSLPHEWR